MAHFDEAPGILTTAGDPHDEIRAKVGQYFDGELAAEDEQAVLDHLADCALCQRELGDVIGIHVAATTPGSEPGSERELT